MDRCMYPGYFGSRTKQIHDEINEKYGKRNWLKAYIMGSQLIDREIALLLYEDAYLAK